jgi:hypothetical protein
MRKWGIVVTLVYTAIVIGLLLPSAILLTGDVALVSKRFLNDWANAYSAWSVWMLAGIFVLSQALLLFLSVDTSCKRLKPKTHIAGTTTVTALLFALLTFAAVLSVDAAAKGPISDALDSWAQAFAVCGALWVIWGIVFLLYLRGSSAATDRAMKWLLRGSVLELLIVVPSHVIVRRRDDCCAPVLTSFGIVTGIAIMLLSFGPGVLLLYKKRIDAYHDREKSSVS